MPKISSKAIKEAVLEKDLFTIPEIQVQTGASYYEVAHAIQPLRDEGKVKLTEGITFECCKEVGKADDEIEPDFDELIARLRARRKSAEMFSKPTKPKK